MQPTSSLPSTFLGKILGKSFKIRQTEMHSFPRPNIEGPEELLSLFEEAKTDSTTKKDSLQQVARALSKLAKGRKREEGRQILFQILRCCRLINPKAPSSKEELRNALVNLKVLLDANLKDLIIEEDEKINEEERPYSPINSNDVVSAIFSVIKNASKYFPTELTAASTALFKIYGLRGSINNYNESRTSSMIYGRPPEPLDKETQLDFAFADQHYRPNWSEKYCEIVEGFKRKYFSERRTFL